ncbi:hypothetical protein [Microbacterium lacticum]|uniref:hypothetical protein n=1 Tax=Microbacterium lacticum TaxID=33885 RepID=UPI001F576971|nr:hypothetical protein [Microbacterium lacticum]
MDLGLDITAARVRAAVMDDATVRWCGEVPVTTSWHRAARDALRDAERATGARVDHVGVAIAPGRDDLDFEELALVRLSAPVASWLAPLSGWPVDLARRLDDRVRVVAGAAGYLGGEAIALNDEALEAAAEHLSRRGARHIVVAGAGALAAPELEREAARRLRVLVAGASVSPSAEAGGAGLRERENAMLLDGALQGWARDVLSQLTQVCGDRPLVFVRGGGGAVAGDYFARHPLGSVESRLRAAVDGALALSDGDDLIVVFGDEGSTSTIGVSGGAVTSPDLALAWGIRHNHQPVERITRSEPDMVPLDTARLARRRPAHDVVVVGDDAHRIEGRRPSLGAFAVAIGATRAEISVRTDRLVSGDAATRSRRIAELAEETRTRLVRAGAAPDGEVAMDVESSPVAYVADDAHTVQIVARAVRRAPDSAREREATGE